MLIIRKSTDRDLHDLLRVQRLAFGEQEGPEIVALVSALLDDPSARPLLSLVAVDNGQTVGHILFTHAELTATDTSISTALLAPLAVIPEAQNKGVGGQLILAGLKQLTATGVELVFVLGYPEYYPRFGFKPAQALGFEPPYPIAREQANAWMVIELRSGTINHVTGTVVCADALNQPQLWRE